MELKRPLHQVDCLLVLSPNISKKGAPIVQPSNRLVIKPTQWLIQSTSTWKAEKRCRKS